MEIARGRGIDVSAFDSLVLLTVSAEERDLALKTARVIAPEGVLISKYQDSIVLVGERRAHNVRRTNKGRLGSQSAHRCTRCPPADGELSKAFTVATQVARLLAGLGVHNGLVETTEYLPYASLFGSDSGEVNAYIETILGKCVALMSSAAASC